jgi:hypothetical protein
MCKKEAKGTPRTLILPIHKCSCCGVNYETDSFDLKQPLPQMMVEKQLCFECAFWTDKIEKTPQNREIINGEHYMFGQFQEDPLCFQGHGGRIFYAVHNDKTLVMSNNVWCQGTVPGRFRNQLPDTAKLISKHTYLQLKNNPFVCKAKGCWDRYHCFRYNQSIEQHAGPWNIVPNTHIPGEEWCESFINKEQL